MLLLEAVDLWRRKNQRDSTLFILPNLVKKGTPPQNVEA
ncbi:MAG: hypothetical protein ACI97N_000910 [Cognaticolwellia sp.]|jgi:hypothetical protein